MAEQKATGSEGVDPGARRLAEIVTIRSLSAIPDSNNIVLATFDQNTFQTVVKKDLHTVGEKIVYFSIDAILNDSPDVAFLKGKLLIQTRTIRGVLSQGLVGPLSWLVFYGLDPQSVTPGQNVTREMRVQKYATPEERHVYVDRKPNKSGLPEACGFPSHLVPQTDEPNIQKYTDELQTLLTNDMDVTVTVKFDGTSCTFLWTNKLQEADEKTEQDFRFYVCSRNHLIFGGDPNDKIYFRVAESLGMESKMRRLGRHMAVQGEICGPKVSNNRLQLAQVDFYVFNIYDLDQRKYLPSWEVEQLAARLELKTVTKIHCGKLLACPGLTAPERDTTSPIDSTFVRRVIDALLQLAASQQYNAQGLIAEGLVIKTDCAPRFSCKAISNLYLQKLREEAEAKHKKEKRVVKRN